MCLWKELEQSITLWSSPFVSLSLPSMMKAKIDANVEMKADMFVCFLCPFKLRRVVSES